MSLFTSGVPYSVVTPVTHLRQDANGCLHWNSRWDRPLRYDVVAGVSAEAEWPASWPEPGSMDPYLQLPPIALDQVASHAQRAVAGARGSAEQAARIAAYLQSNFRYSTELGDAPTKNPVEHFLNVSKQGPCGHFASAMAVMLRLQGIPCRLVAGYFRGEFNEPAQQHVIRQADAHAWVEAYFPETGWVRFDPSPRQASGSGPNRRWYHGLRQYWDYVGLKWDRLVIDYDLYAQLRAFERVRNSSVKANQSVAGWWERYRRKGATQSEPGRQTSEGAGIPRSLWAFAGLVAIVGIGLGLRHRAPSNESKAVRDYQRFVARLGRRGLQKGSSETAAEFLARVSGTAPELASVAKTETARYTRARFERGETPALRS
jgi:protein-glutamine gamma-glutamyltransferase